MLYKLIIQYIVSQSTYITIFCIHFYKKILKYVFLHKNKECNYALPISPSLKRLSPDICPPHTPLLISD